MTTEIPSEAFEEILKELQRKPLELNRYRTKAGDGRSQAFGIVGKRSMAPDYSRQCWKRPKLYKLLLDFAKEYVKIPFTSITVNDNFKAAAHRDKNNVGVSLLVAFGDFQGGEIQLLEGDMKGDYDIRHKALVHDFSKTLHCVKEYIGSRYSLVFYQYESKRWPYDMKESSVRVVDGKYMFYIGEEVCNGLPHPLRGRIRGEKILENS